MGVLGSPRVPWFLAIYIRVQIPSHPQEFQHWYHRPRMMTMTGPSEPGSTPQEQMSQPSLPEIVNFSTTPLDGRKKLVRHILASFDEKELPSEYRPEIYASIDEQQAKRPAYEWTIGDDLPGTLMRHACHSVRGWNLLVSLESDEVRGRKFGQKIRRRFEQKIREHHDGAMGPPGTDLALSHLNEDLRKLATIILQGFEGQTQGLHELPYALEEVCKRNTASPREHQSLYQALILHGQQGEESIFAGFEKILSGPPKL
jgi:hypothetical protein